MKKLIVIDASNASLGRLASFAAKAALQGNEVVIVNVEKAIIVGKPRVILQHYLTRFRLGHGALKGPLYSRTAVGICRRAIRGMIGWKKPHGKKAFKHIKCYESIPEQFKAIEKLSFPKQALRFITLGRLATLIRGK